jgi:hypothetical protein
MRLMKQMQVSTRPHAPAALPSMKMKNPPLPIGYEAVGAPQPVGNLGKAMLCLVIEIEP